MSKEKLVSVLDGITQLPTLPTIYTKINSLLRSEDSQASEIAKIIESDQSMALKILRLVNSSYFGFSRTVTRVSHAVVLLGFDAVRNAVLSISVLDSFGKESKAGFDRKQFWQHSIATATIARFISRELKLGNDDDAFAAGIIHDIGKLVLDQYFPEEFACVLAEAEKDPRPLHLAERSAIGTDHCEIGEYLAERWQLPHALVEAVALHHTPAVLRSNPALVALIHTSDSLAHRFGLGGNKDLPRPPLDPVALEELGITGEDLRPLAGKLRDLLRDSKEMLTQYM